MLSKLYLLYTLICLSFKFGFSIHGCVPLDSYSFEKIVSKFNAALIKFDTAYPYGSKQDVYEKICGASRDVNDLLTAEVSVKDYGEKDNADLAEKYNVQKDDFPVVKLFIQGKEEPFTFSPKNDNEFTEENIKEFIRSKSNVYIGLQGCIEEFDRIAEKFINEKTVDGRNELLKEAENLLNKSKSDRQKKNAEVYIKYMKKTFDQDSFGKVGFTQLALWLLDISSKHQWSTDLDRY
ncbi:endoplasmic reticulum protein 29-like protein wbl isoform X2 [Lycorma delicatula]|uniref:endoplasmic reticulum protein 29-like protein wbl isoform X2 n=1 Tax=Lycorma delicatula TaxID=130591 RepID=UPI003F51A1F1